MVVLMINEIIKQIVDLDNRAEFEINKIKEEVSEIEDSTTREIQFKESTKINNLTKELDELLESKVNEAVNDKEIIIRDTEAIYNKLNERYESIKVQLAQDIIKLLLQEA